MACSVIRSPVSSLIVVLCMCLLSCNAFTLPSFPSSPRAASTISSSQLASTTTDDNSFIDNITQRYNIFQKAKSEGYDFKQSTAITIAGEYDEEAAKNKINEEINSASCVMFTWEASPSCKQAIKYLDIAGANYKVVRLDDPWSEGNPIRAELGRMVGRSSVPCIFMGGKYVGGFDGGVGDGDESPGLMEMAFKGTLQDRLKEVGAL